MPESHSHDRVFKSKRGKWITVFIWLSALLLCFFAYGIMISPGPLIERVIGATITLSIGLIAPWFWLSTFYRVTESSLYLNSGMFHKELKLHSIRRVTYKGDGSGHSFAFSRNSMHIEVEGSDRGYRISPLDSKGFIMELGKRCSHLTAEGEDLVLS